MEINKDKTLAAETLAFVDGIDTGKFVQGLAEELIKPQSQIVGVTDSRSLHDAAQTSTQIKDRRLRVEMSTICDCVEKGEAVIVWTNNENQLADVMTKQGASPKFLLGVVGSGRIQQE